LVQRVTPRAATGEAARVSKKSTSAARAAPGSKEAARDILLDDGLQANNSFATQQGA
jgi:hypothetical protein